MVKVHPHIPRTKTINGKRYSLDAVRHKKSFAKGRAEDQKKHFWKRARVVKAGDGWAVYVHGRK